MPNWNGYLGGGYRNPRTRPQSQGFVDSNMGMALGLGGGYDPAYLEKMKAAQGQRGMGIRDPLRGPQNMGGMAADVNNTAGQRPQIVRDPLRGPQQGASGLSSSNQVPTTSSPTQPQGPGNPRRNNVRDVPAQFQSFLDRRERGPSGLTPQYAPQGGVNYSSGAAPQSPYQNPPKPQQVQLQPGQTQMQNVPYNPYTAAQPDWFAQPQGPTQEQIDYHNQRIANGNRANNGAWETYLPFNYRQNHIPESWGDRWSNPRDPVRGGWRWYG